MRSYKTYWKAYAEGVAVQASWSDAEGDFSNLAFATWHQLEEIANWRATLDQVPPPLVGEGYIAVAGADGSVAIYTTTASSDFAPNQFLCWLRPKTLAWLLNEKRPAATDARPFAALRPAILDREFVAKAKRARRSAGAATITDSNGTRQVRL